MTWKKGQSGNPAGRPKNVKYFSEVAKELLEARKIKIQYEINGNKKNLDLKTSKTISHGLVSALIVEGLKGNVKAAQFLVERIEGRPDQRLKHEGGLNLTGKTDEELVNLIKQLDA